MEESRDARRSGGLRNRRILLAAALVALVAAGTLLWIFRDALRSPATLNQLAQRAEPSRAAELYDALGRRLPEIEEYARLWAAEARMPDVEALLTLQAVTDLRPESPAAFQSHLALARYYATLEAPQAEEAYRAALEVDDPVSVRLELARHLEEVGDDDAAYAAYRSMLGERPDAFAGMRRTGADPVTVAEDLNAAYYFSDAVEVLREVSDPAALPARARALQGLGRYAEAREAYETWMEASPDDEEARQGLIEVLEALGLPEEAADLQDDGGEENSGENGANGNEDSEEEAEDEIDLYLESGDPVDWWSATTLLERQGRLTETLPIYERIAGTDSYLADDAAYRLHVLSGRLDDEEAQGRAEELLGDLELSWLTVRATGEVLELPSRPEPAEAGHQLLAKAEALEAIGRTDLARRELVLAARARRAPEIDLAMAQALDARGYVLDAQPIAESFIGQHGRAPRSFWRLSYPRPYSATVTSAGQEFNVDPLLVWSIMRQESRFDPGAFGYVAERGLMQVLPTTQDWIAEQLGEEISPGEAFTPEANVRMGAWYLRHLLDYYDGDLVLTVSAYNGGPGNVDSWLEDPSVSDREDFLRWMGFGQTREYAETVLLNYLVYQDLYAELRGEGGD